MRAMAAKVTVGAAMAFMVFGNVAFPAQAKEDRDRSAKDRSERTVTSRDMGGRAERSATFRGPGDYSIRYGHNGGEKNFRLREGDTQREKLREGDRVTRERSTLSK
jgi:hypothetical protein